MLCGAAGAGGVCGGAGGVVSLSLLSCVGTRDVL